MNFFTIGVYHSTEDQFFAKLQTHRIDTFCDIRQRRAVRGSTYAFANSNRLQIKLAQLGMRYLHVTSLAPTTAMRQLQYHADEMKGVGKRDRQELSPAFRSAYHKQITSKFNFNSFIEDLTQMKARRIVLFCVEENAQACHRSVVAEELGKRGFLVTHL